MREAVATLDALTASVEISLNCRDAALVERTQQSQVTWHEWQLRGKRKPVRRRISHALHLMSSTGRHDRQAGSVRLVRVSTPSADSPQRQLARTRWAARSMLSSHPFPDRELGAEVHLVRGPLVQMGRQSLALAGLVISMAALLLLSAGLWANLGLDEPKYGSLVVIWLGVYTVVGVVLALRRTAVHRAVPWLVTLAIPLVVPLIPWLGSLVQRAYLVSFGMRPVPGDDGFGNVLAGGWILSVSMGALLLPIAHRGWVRYLNYSNGFRNSSTSWALTVASGVCVAMLFSLCVLVVAGREGATGRRVAENGRDVPEYFGVNAEYVCIKMSSNEAPYYGDQPPMDRPVITFGRDGDRVNFWDSSTGNRGSIRLEDAQVKSVAHMNSQCARAE
ncbi:hypothetical protein [Streptomyces rimosus]|uniref:hypothetical protein n=1 Tax=Streptomyces rimosus TaxID=1927 RepID=UPI00131C5CED|nr:hypothetical protein [Streptomyces rimosus]